MNFLISHRLGMERWILVRLVLKDNSVVASYFGEKPSLKFVLEVSFTIGTKVATADNRWPML